MTLRTESDTAHIEGEADGSEMSKGPTISYPGIRVSQAAAPLILARRHV